VLSIVFNFIIKNFFFFFWIAISNKFISDWYDVVQISVYNLQTESGDPHGSYVTLKAIQHFVDANWDRLCTGRYHFLFFFQLVLKFTLNNLFIMYARNQLLYSLSKDSISGFN